MPEGTIYYHAGTVFRERCSVYPNISPNIIAIGSAIHFSLPDIFPWMGNRAFLRLQCVPDYSQYPFVA